MWKLIAKGLLRLGGWTAVGEKPTFPKAIFIVAPHTSNWDGIWALIYVVSIDMKVRFFAKQSMFVFPLSLVLRILGGIPLDRSEPGSAARKAVDAFQKNESFYFGLAPEGTRSLKPHWKSGFYRIAKGAEVPIVLGFIDYGNRRVGVGPVIDPTDDRSADMARIREFYASITGRWPEKTSPAVFPGDPL
jgi:1-acyl-sn-glycerol-3-phosphate acyltransferase